MRHSRECLTIVARYSCEHLTTVVRHCADRGNFLAMCLRTSAKGWRRVRDGFATYAMTWRRFFNIFCCTKKSITCLKLWRPVRDEIAMHARTLRYHANVLRQFRDSSQRFGESMHKPIANSSHPSEIGALVHEIIDHPT